MIQICPSSAHILYSKVFLGVPAKWTPGQPAPTLVSHDSVSPSNEKPWEKPASKPWENTAVGSKPWENHVGDSIKSPEAEKKPWSPEAQKPWELPGTNKVKSPNTVPPWSPTATPAADKPKPHMENKALRELEPSPARCVRLKKKKIQNDTNCMVICSWCTF